MADAMKPDFQGVRTYWNQGFMTFRKPRRTRIAMLMIPVGLESGLRTRDASPRPLAKWHWVRYPWRGPAQATLTSASEAASQGPFDPAIPAHHVDFASGVGEKPCEEENQQQREEMPRGRRMSLPPPCAARRRCCPRPRTGHPMRGSIAWSVAKRLRRRVVTRTVT